MSIISLKSSFALNLLKVRDFQLEVRKSTTQIFIFYDKLTTFLEIVTCKEQLKFFLNLY